MNRVELAILEILVWGLVASLGMTAVLHASQNLGWSRLNFPFLIGTAFTGDRRAANVLGFVLYFSGGWFFAFFYYLVFALLGTATWSIGLAIGLVHGILLLTALLPLLPYIHPRVASEYDDPTVERPLEPPGFLALHYGYRTPLVTLLAQALYGTILGATFRV